MDLDQKEPSGLLLGAGKNGVIRKMEPMLMLNTIKINYTII